MKQEFNDKEYSKIGEIDVNNLVSDMSKNASLYSFYGYQEEEWVTVRSHLEQLIEIREAQLDQDIRLAAKAAGEKEPSVNSIKSQIILDSELQSLNKKLNAVDAQCRLYRLAKNFLVERGKMMQSINTRQREEWSSRQAAAYQPGSFGSISVSSLLANNNAKNDLEAPF